MNRRDFIKGSAALAGAAAVAACGTKKEKKQPEGEMTCRTNPSSSDKVSLLGFGMMRLPVFGGGSARENPEATLDQEGINRLVDRAIELGVNYFDTAPIYCKGHSEKATGIALNRYPRDKWFVATKMSTFDRNSWTFKASKAMYDKSFTELGVDYIDYYLLHSVGGSQEAFRQRFIDNGVLDFLMQERQEGRIRNLGFSFHGDNALFDYLMELHQTYKWDFVQIQMNYVDWDNAKKINARNSNASDLYGKLEALGIPVVIMEPLLGGRLASLPGTVAQALQEIDPSRSIASWAFRFCGTYPGVLTVLSGMTYLEHLEDNAYNFSPLVPLAGEELEFLINKGNVIASYPTVPCNNCEYCMPCPYGMDIPKLLSHYNKCVNEGYIQPDSQSSEYRRLRRKYLSTYAKELIPERQADKCIGCEECVDKCPQHINIPHEIARIDRYVEKLRREE